MNFLAIPVLSAQSERENSKVKNVMTCLHNRFLGIAVQATLCSKSRLPVLNIHPNEEFVLSSFLLKVSCQKF